MKLLQDIASNCKIYYLATIAHIKIAIGIVIAIVNSPQGDSARAFTTTIERIAMIISIIPNIAIIVTPPTDATTLTFIMMAYGFIAAVLPVWFLLAPRDYLSTFLKIGV